MTTKQFLTKYWYLTAGVVGVLSGIAVPFIGNDLLPNVLPKTLTDGSILPWFIPGAIFGIFSAGYFSCFLIPKPALWKLFLWTIASSVSYYLAVMSGFSSSRGGDIWSLGMGGIIGVLVLIIAFRPLFFRLKDSTFVSLLFVGGLIPMLVDLGTEDPLNSAFLYIFWQTAVLLIFAYQIHLSAKASQSASQISVRQ